LLSSTQGEREDRNVEDGRLKIRERRKRGEKIYRRSACYYSNSYRPREGGRKGEALKKRPKRVRKGGKKREKKGGGDRRHRDSYFL